MNKLEIKEFTKEEKLDCLQHLVVSPELWFICEWICFEYYVKNDLSLSKKNSATQEAKRIIPELAQIEPPEDEKYDKEYFGWFGSMKNPECNERRREAVQKLIKIIEKS